MSVNNPKDVFSSLDLLEEKWENAFIREAKYKESLVKYYNECVKVNDFKCGDLVLRKNKDSEAEPLGKLAPNWEEPYRVQRRVATGNYQFETLEEKTLPRIWHVRNLMKFFT